MAAAGLATRKAIQKPRAAVGRVAAMTMTTTTGADAAPVAGDPDPVAMTTTAADGSETPAVTPRHRGAAGRADATTGMTTVGVARGDKRKKARSAVQAGLVCKST
jgi:hypothetical protein